MLSDLSTSSLVFVYTVGVVQGVDSLVTPALKSILSKAVDHEDQGIIILLLYTLLIFVAPPPLPSLLLFQVLYFRLCQPFKCWLLSLVMFSIPPFTTTPSVWTGTMHLASPSLSWQCSTSFPFLSYCEPLPL